jgi:hypothetical protein
MRVFADVLGLRPRTGFGRRESAAWRYEDVDTHLPFDFQGVWRALVHDDLVMTGWGPVEAPTIKTCVRGMSAALQSELS